VNVIPAGDWKTDNLFYSVGAFLIEGEKKICLEAQAARSRGKPLP
jgi:hypothetical protein